MVKAVNENRLYEAFGAGTAASVSPVMQFTYDNNVYKIPIDEEKQAGKLTQTMLKML
jgi:branched-chain amino acid aminotransferase